jgi:hypothetical protein
MRVKPRLFYAATSKSRTTAKGGGGGGGLVPGQGAARCVKALQSQTELPLHRNSPSWPCSGPRALPNPLSMAVIAPSMSPPSLAVASDFGRRCCYALLLLFQGLEGCHLAPGTWVLGGLWPGWPLYIISGPTGGRRFCMGSPWSLVSLLCFISKPGATWSLGAIAMWLRVD